MKTLIIGLDGVPRRLLEELCAAGVMPRLAAFVREGSLHDLAASIPEISSVSWSSFMTGADPGTHGIFGFTDLAPGSRKIRFPRFSDLAAPTFWDRLGARGLRSVVINQPSTYPAREIPGALVSGFVALDLDRAVHPARHLRRLREIGYVIDVDTRGMRDGGDRREALLAELEDALPAREEAIGYLWDAERWDIFQFVETGTDRLQHFLWDALEDEGDPLHARVLDYYRAVDALAGRLIDRFRETAGGGAVFVLSDHGFTRSRREVRINAWLEEQGYLSFRNGERSLENLSDETRAFALDPARIHITSTSPSRDEVAREITARLEELSFEGEAVIRAVHRREEIYHGPRSEAGPDLVVQARDGFDLKASLREREVFASPRMSGMHNPEAFLLADRPLGDDLGIADVARFIEEPYDGS